MGTLLTVLGVTVALALWDLTGETAAEYVAKYVVDQDDLGASTREPSSLPAAPAETRTAAATVPATAAPAIPVLLSGAGRLGSADPTKPAADWGRGGQVVPASAPVGAGVPASRPSPSSEPPSVSSNAPSGAPAVAAAAPAQDVDPLLSLIGDTPFRKSDGTVFMPIAAQRVFGFRTVIGQQVAVPATMELPGRVVTDPSTAHLIQSAQEGFVQIAGAGFPFAGQRVKRGDLLATLRPALTTVERAEIDARMQELTNGIDLERKRMARLEEVVMVRYRASRIEQMRVEIAGMRRQLEILRNSVDRPIELRAQTDGVVSAVNAAPGQFLHAGHTMFEIVDPSRLWVSASAFEPGVRDRIVSASALTAGNRRIELQFVGGGLELRHQALPLHFEVVDADGGLTVDTPVTVIVQLEGVAVSGLRVPRAAVTRTSDGRDLVWERRAAESFVAHHVSLAGIDALSVLVTSPMPASARIVTAGVAMLGQVQ